MENQTIHKLKELTEERKQLFEEYLQITRELTGLREEDVERITAGIGQREALAARIDVLTEECRAVCSTYGEEVGQQEGKLQTILQCGADFSLLREEEKELFLLCQSVNRILSEIQDLNGLLHRNFQDIRKRLQESIRRNNTDSKFAGYLNQMNYGASKGVLYDSRK